MKYNYVRKNNLTEETAGITGVEFEETDLDKLVLQIPETLDGLCVTTIEKKAFLGLRGVRRICLPAGIKEVGDWAFAHCVSLERVEFLSKEGRSLVFGKDVFLGCENLKCLSFGEEAQGELLAALLKRMPVGRLLGTNPQKREEWFLLLDELLTEFLMQEDTAGYEGLWTFGEEDYSERKFDGDIYCEERRMEKVELLYLRLLHKEYLLPERKEAYENYLKKHSLGEKTEEAFFYLQKGKQNRISYFEILKQAGGIHEKNRLSMLEKLEEASAEVRAFLMESPGEKNDLFDDLIL